MEYVWPILWPGWLLQNIYVTNDHGYVPFVIVTIWSFPHSWLITGFVTIVTRQVPHVEQEWPTLPEHLSSLPVFSGVCVAWSIIFCVVFCRLLFVLWSLSDLWFMTSDNLWFMTSDNLWFMTSDNLWSMTSDNPFLVTSNCSYMDYLTYITHLNKVLQKFSTARPSLSVL
jgi:hypothetical protein